MKDKDLNDTSGQLQESRLQSEKVFDGRLLQVYIDEVKLPDGTTSTREWIKHPGACAIVPVFEDGTIMLLKQFRYPPHKTFVEVPAGKIDPGEDPKETARRELIEETGIRCTNLAEAGSFYPAIGYADEIIHIYTAWGLTRKKQNSDDDEFLLNYRILFSKALSMVQSGEIMDGKTICTLLKAKFWWENNAPFDVSFS